MNYRQTSANEWQWQEGSKTYSVRVMPATASLIWSAWAQVGDAPVFEPGHKQAFTTFLKDGSGPYPAPAALLAELRAALEPPAKRAVFRRLIGR
jgi:hypothetical protein